MPIKWHKNGSADADDREKEICYTDTVYKWVPRRLLVFIFRKGDQLYEVLSILWGDIGGSTGFILPEMRENSCRSNLVFGTRATGTEEKAEQDIQKKKGPEKKNGRSRSDGIGSSRSLPGRFLEG